jgi:hypothetical protein
MNIDYYLARMERLTEDYLADAEKLERSRRPNELFGLKFGPSDDPLHERFARDMAELMRAFAAEEPDSAALREVLKKLLSTAKANPEPRSAYWMLIAVQGLSKELIPGLSREDAAALAKDYESAWPRHSRLPVQDDVLRALKKAAK